MSDRDFDAIVVGSGCAGAVAAYELAKQDKSVLVVERGNSAGAKNMTGGRLYSHALKAVFPEYEQEAPLERKITHERIALMAPSSNLSIDFTSDMMQESGRDSYSVLRAPFDAWLAQKAEDAGAEYIYGIAVEELIKENGVVIGIRAGEDVITAQVVILADGANSLLASQAVGARIPAAHQMAVGIKQIIELPSQLIEDRTLCNPGEGMAWLFAGDATKGTIGGGFMYTNKDSISLGLVATISDLAKSKTPVYQMLEDFKAHPAVAPLIKGGVVREHSGHMVAEGGFDMMPELVGEGVLLAGETASMCMNLGYQVRGMDFALSAGQYAGQTAATAIEAGDTSKAGLQNYATLLKDSYVLKDLMTFRKFPHFMESTKRIFNEYPVMVGNMMNGLFIVDGQPSESLKKTMFHEVKKLGIGNMLKDVRGGMKAL